MSKCVTSEHCCEISNLIHEEVVVGWWSEDGLLQAALKKNPWLLKKLSLATKRESTHISNKHRCDVSVCDFKKTSTSTRQRELMCHLVFTVFKCVYCQWRYYKGRHLDM